MEKWSEKLTDTNLPVLNKDVARGNPSAFLHVRKA